MDFLFFARVYNSCFSFFYIHHQQELVALSYLKQKYEKKKQELLMKKQDLKQALQESHDLAHIKEFALNANMKKVSLDQIKTVPDEQQP